MFTVGPGERLLVEHEQAGKAEHQRRPRIPGHAIRPRRLRIAPAEHQQRDADQQEEEIQKTGVVKITRLSNPGAAQSEAHDQRQRHGRLNGQRSGRGLPSRAPAAQPGIQPVFGPQGIVDSRPGEDRAVDGPQGGNADQQADQPLAPGAHRDLQHVGGHALAPHARQSQGSGGRPGSPARR